jgi:CRP/FNR family cyclic AMP-dependent transcriptional regulator
MQTSLLRAIPFLRELSDEEIQMFSSLLSTRMCKSGERILEEGVAPDAFYIVCDGVVHVRRRANTREMLMGRIGAGGFFGEVNLFDPGVATASIISMQQSRLAVISYEKFREFMENNTRAGYRISSALMKEMAQRLRATNARLVNSVFWAPNASS